jgi:pyridinium-3,5-biscarboxylic acid mononucleotide synthase
VPDEPRPEKLSGDEILADLRAALDGNSGESENPGTRLDVRRFQRVGAPEIILAEHKSSDQILKLVEQMLEANGSVLISRINGEKINALIRTFGNDLIEHPDGSTMVRIVRNAVGPGNENLQVARSAIFTAGTSDLPRAHEVRLVCEEMSVDCRIWSDVGVAGIHRLIQPFREAVDWDASAIVVVAGMDGALPSVISGLSPVPVIGLPVSVGYGYGGRGEGALMAMLQTCAPGLTVVNIDNSVGAGIAAARIALQASRASR